MMAIKIWERYKLFSKLITLNSLWFSKIRVIDCIYKEQKFSNYLIFKAPISVSVRPLGVKVNSPEKAMTLREKENAPRVNTPMMLRGRKRR